MSALWLAWLRVSLHETNELNFQLQRMWAHRNANFKTPGLRDTSLQGRDGSLPTLERSLANTIKVQAIKI
jgi:hypothetical protein